MTHDGQLRRDRAKKRGGRRRIRAGKYSKRRVRRLPPFIPAIIAGRSGASEAATRAAPL
jgi:hypothetical protein